MLILKNKYLQLILTLVLGLNALGQINIVSNPNAVQMATTIMAPTNNIVPGSVNLNCPNGAYGTFTNGFSDGLSIDEGIILTTGQTSVFEQDNLQGSAGNNNGVTGFQDPDLIAMEPLATFDGCLLEFDIIPVCNQLKLDYIWGSDEYPEFVNGGYNDAFGFFVSGPGIVGVQNIATVPGTSQLVSIDNVNNNANSQYYVDNTGGNRVEYDGYTQNLDAIVQVIPCETYHLKIVCADAGDGIYDSGVLISVNQPPCTFNSAAWVGVNTVAVEGCQDFNVNLTRTGDVGFPLDVDITVEGTATDGLDFTYGAISHSFAPNDSIDLINIPTISDALSEGAEIVRLIATVNNCGISYSDTIDLVLNDVQLQIDSTVTAEVCAGNCNGEVTLAAQGMHPMTYTWDHGPTDSTLTGLCPGQYIATVTDGNGCSLADTVTILPGDTLKDATITSPKDTLCVAESGILLSGAEGGGTWVGTGMNALGVFDPAAAGVGNHTVEYHLTHTCGDSATYDLVVNPLLDASITPGLDTLFCEADTSYTFTAINPIGIWIGPGTDTLTGHFNPSAAGVGTHQIIHVIVDSCGSADTLNVEVIALKDPTITAAKTTFCLADDSLVLAAAHAGGVWSGMGMTATTGAFDPGTAGVGQHEVIYTITGFCGQADTVQLDVSPIKDATILGQDSVTACILDVSYDFQVQVDTGTWSNPAVTAINDTGRVDLATLGVGTHQLIYSMADPCGDQDTVWITITGQLLATITDPGPYCEDNILDTLRAANSGGTWSGPGIDANSGAFNPSVAGAGTHEIIYTISGNCGHSDTIDVVVTAYDDPTITFTDTLVCNDFGTINLSAVDPTGTWGVLPSGTAGLDAAAATFDANVAGAGNYQITYSFAGQCPSADTLGVEIQAYPDSLVDPMGPFCESWGNQAFVPNTAGGSYAGNGVVGTDFSPVLADTGTHTITYSVGSLCAVTYSFDVIVLPDQSANIDPVPDQCTDSTAVNLNVTNTSPGIWTGTGIANANTAVFNPSLAGAGTHTISYEIAGQCGDTATQDVVVHAPIDPTIVPPPALCEGFNSLTINTNSSGGTWSGDAFVSAVGSLDNSLTEGVYKIYYSFTGVCNSIDSVNMVILDVPFTDFTLDPAEGCIPFSVNFTDASDSVPTSSRWDFGNGLTSTAAGAASTVYAVDGCYSIFMENVYSNGCKNSVTKVDAVCGFPIPTADFSYSPAQIDIRDQVVVFENLSADNAASGATAGNLNYFWDFSSLAQDSSSRDVNPIVRFTAQEQDTAYVELIVVNEQGCSDTLVRPIPIDNIPTLYIPNAFTPDGNGINDVFYPVTNEYKLTNYEFYVYNRWGTKIFESTNPGEGWDGTVNNGFLSSGKPAQEDVYVYKVYFETSVDVGIPQTIVGTVTIVR